MKVSPGRGRSRWWRGRIRWHSESGLTGVDGVIIAGAVLVSALAVGAVGWSIKEVHDWLNAEPPIQPVPLRLPHIEPNLPANAQVRDCYIQLAAREQLFPGPQGWETPYVDKPTGDAAKSQQQWNDYAARVDSYINSRHINWSSCAETSAPPPVQPPPATLVYQGTYTLNYPDIAGSADGGACPPFGGPPGKIDVTGSGENASIQLPSRTVSASYYDTISGGVSGSYSFSMHGTREAGSTGADSPSLTIQMIGTFDTDTSSGSDTPTVVIRGGQLSYGGSVQCSWNFTGTKTGS